MVDSIKLLIIDDETAFVDLLSKRLRNRGLTVECAYNGPDAPKIIDTDADFDAVVLDMNMPVMDGMDTLKEIKKIRPDLAVMILTGHGTLDSALEGLKCDAHDYLVKPIEIEQLLSKLKEIHRNKYEEKETSTWPGKYA